MGLLDLIFWRKPKLSSQSDKSLMVDFHSHLLPGIDDGCNNITQSLEIVRELQKQGVKHIITTPHIIQGLYPNTPEIIGRKKKDLEKAMAEEGIDISLEAAAEYYLDEWFMEQMKENRGFLTFAGRHILIETNYIEKPHFLEAAIFNLNVEKYSIVFAHPERYHYLLKDFGQFERLHDSGVLFQLNLMSLTGHYGPQVLKAANYLLNKGLVDLVGSDIHKIEHARMISHLKRTESYRKLEPERWLNNFFMPKDRPE
jgi:tyrosine-protein phosphatase YwqE